MSSEDKTWQMTNCEKSKKISWDFNITRIYGWYGQDEIEFANRFLDIGII